MPFVACGGTTWNAEFVAAAPRGLARGRAVASLPDPEIRSVVQPASRCLHENLLGPS